MTSQSNGATMKATIKAEPTATTTPAVRSQRLQGFKVPRDLSLGAKDRGSPAAAAAANKKVFTPNLNVTRNKSTASTDTAASANGRNAKNGRSERGRGGRGGPSGTRGRGGKACIQSIGLFSEGIAGQPLRRTSQARPSYSEGSTASQMRRPTIGKDSQKFNEQSEQQSLQDFLNDDGDGDGQLETMTSEDDFNIPVVLKEAQTRVELEEHKRYPESLAGFFQRTTPQLFLIQLPDTLPGQGNELVDVKKSDKGGGGSETTEEATSEPNFCLMKGLQEGLIGKFIRYKSGKTKLVLGNTRFDADLGLEPGFLQEVVSVRTNAAERNGDMINLGKIGAKVNVSPDWEDMFQSLNAA